MHIVQQPEKRWANCDIQWNIAHNTKEQTTDLGKDMAGSQKYYVEAAFCVKNMVSLIHHGFQHSLFSRTLKLGVSSHFLSCLHHGFALQ